MAETDRLAREAAIVKAKKEGESDKFQAVIKAVENEWNNPVEFRYLQTCLRDRKEFLYQLRRRFPPNLIQATIDMEGDFDSRTRIYYQIGDIFGRCLPSLRRVSKTLMSGSHK